MDGDTVEVHIDLGFYISHRMTVRLLGVNTPERGQPGYKEAKDFVAQYQGMPVVIWTVKDRTEKFGRYLAKVTVVTSTSMPIDLSLALINEGLGVTMKTKF